MPKYDDFVKNQSAHRVLLVDLDGYSVSTQQVQTIHFSTHSEGDYQHYVPRITKTPIILRSFDKHQPEGGTIEIDNSDGLLDSLMYHNFAGRDIRFYHGDASWPLVDFKQFGNVFSGKIVSFEVVSDNKFQVEFSAGNNNLDAPLTTAITSFGGAQPVCYGTCKNITPILVDEGTRKYRVHSGEVEDVCSQLYVNGATSNIVVAKNNTDGSFTLASVPDGSVTCNVIGASGGLHKGGAIIQDMLTRYGHLDISDINVPSLEAYDDSAPDIGVYFKDGSINLIDAINQVLASHAAFFSFSREGLFSIVRPLPLATGKIDFTSIWVSNDTVAPAPLDGRFGFDIVDGVGLFYINKFDDAFIDQTTELDKLTQHDEVYVEQISDARRWMDLRITSIQLVADVYQMEVTLYDVANFPRKNVQCNVRLTTFTATPSQRPTTVWIDDSKLVGDIRITHDPRKPVWRSTIGYDKNWTVQDNVNTAFSKNEYRYVDAPDDRGEGVHGEIYGDSLAGFPKLTNIVSPQGAQNEADLRQAFQADQHYYIAPQTYLVGFTAELGEIVEITSDRFLLTDQRFMILEIEEDMLNSTSTIKGWW